MFVENVNITSIDGKKRIQITFSDVLAGKDHYLTTEEPMPIGGTKEQMAKYFRCFINALLGMEELKEDENEVISSAN